jgi:YVTN family beta-propeller protein
VKRLPILVLALLCFAAARPATPRPAVVYAVPAGSRPAGALGADYFNAVLPSGRVVSPAGRSVLVGMNALGTTLAFDGRLAVTTCDDERQSRTRSQTNPGIFGGYSLAVIDTATMRVLTQYRAEGEAFFAGVVAVPDPRDPSHQLVFASGGPTNVVYAFTLADDGRLVPDGVHHVISMPGPIDPAFGDEGHAFPATLVAAKDNRTVYVVNELADTISAIDVATRTLQDGTQHVGYFPFGAAIVGSRALVTNEGLMRYASLPQPRRAPPFRNVTPDLERASSLSLVPLDASGRFASAPDAALQPSAVPLDPTPDGVRTIGGAHPDAVVGTPDKAYAYVAFANIDRVATVALAGTPHVVGGTELRLFDKGPYGTQPTALALSRDGSRLYVALAGLNAVAVVDARDPVHLHRLGLIPTGWYPTALALADDDRTLYVTNTKGFGHEPGFTGDPATDADSNAVWSTLQRIDLATTNLATTTRQALANTRVVAAAKPNRVVPQTLAQGASKVIKHVVFILEENKTYDSMLGDLTDASGRPYGPGDPQFTMYGASVTPNLHALARTYGLAANIFADAEESDAGHQFAAGGIATPYTERTLFVKSGRRPLVNKNEDPEDYPRAGYIFDALARHGSTYRDYGDLVRVSGYDEGENGDPKVDDPNFAGMDDTNAPTSGLGGVYSEDVPAPSALANHVDLDYPGWNLRIRDERRAHEFIRDYDPLVRANAVPAYTYIWLPADHGGSGRDIPPIAEEVADGDRALGEIVQYLTHLPTYASTAIVVMPDDAQSTRDHVDEYRTYAIVISPYAKRGYLGKRHLSTTSVLKTTEELLGLPALSLGDLLATDMADFFTTKPLVAPYTAIQAAPQTASREGARIANLLALTDQSEPDSDAAGNGRVLALARIADITAAHRRDYTATAYAKRQGELWAAAVRAVSNG